jgi:desampylase
VLDAIAAHARMERPRECCGLLLGSDDLIVEAVPLENVAADGMRRYQIAPADYLAQIKSCRQRGDIAVVGAYHSHPRSEPVPSPTDLAEAFEHFWFVIAGPVSDETPVAIRAFQLAGTSFAEAPLRPV